VSGLCRCAGLTRQAYYRSRPLRRQRERNEEALLCAVRKERLQMPRLGTRKLQHRLRSAGMNVGRDHLFGLLRRREMLIRAKRKQVRTTYHDQTLPVYRNLLYDLTLTCCNQAWAADITYINTAEGYIYLCLITDLYSRRIVGWYPSETLLASDTLKALDVALRDLPANCHPIHHSDRGCQYCCHQYVAALSARGLPVSMTEKNHCYENACAERVNGILKLEFNLDSTFASRSQAILAIEQAVHTYNSLRPHFSLNLRTPNEVHQIAA